MLYRFQLDLAIPEAIYNSIPLSTKTAIRDRIRQLKSYAVKINEGAANEELTVKATWQKCHHDTGELCEPEQEI